MSRVRQSVALLKGAPDPWSRADDGGAAGLDRLQAVGRNLGVARLLVSTEDGDAPLDVWCGPVSSRAMRPLPIDARPVAGYRRMYCRPGILALPLRGPHVVFGVLTLIARSERQGWSDEQIQGGLELAHWLAEARARFVARRRALENSDFSRAVLASVSGDVAVLDATGRLVATNDSWEASAASLNPVVKGTCGIGILTATTLASEPRARLATAIGAVLRDQRPQPMLEFSWDDAAGPHWCEVRVQPLGRPARGVVLTHQDVTARKRAEAEAQRHLHEVARVNTVSDVGELAAAVAHELNQPLTAVLSNAQAARRILTGASPCLADVRDILDDIIEQDKRAGEVIQRIRRILKNERFDWAPVDLNGLVRDVIHLLSNQAALAGVKLASSLDARLPRVRGDRVQLQQLVLNLLLNGIQAASSQHAGAPAVAIATQRSGTAVRLIVADSGPGMPPEGMARIFDPFYTTRPDGLGVGLSISRSIVEVHGGELSAGNQPSGGAEFVITLPAEGTTT
jgi:C4-dicarboxylate-specific signal transduction histidine kinase